MINTVITRMQKKIIGLIKTVGLFSLFGLFIGYGFAQCPLLPTMGGGSIASGASITGRSITGQTHTQTCEANDALLTCIGTQLSPINLINTFKYKTCIPAVFKNCNTADGYMVKDRTNTVLYSATGSTATITCQQINVSSRCNNGVFEGIDFNVYKYGNCVNQSYQQCIHPFTSQYVNNGTIVSAFSKSGSTNTQTCSDRKTTLTCLNGSRVGTGYETCNGAANLDCTLLGQSYSNGAFATGYRYSVSTFPKTCEDPTIAQRLQCVNGARLGGNASTYKYNSCTAGIATGCAAPSGWETSKGNFYNSGDAIPSTFSKSGYTTSNAGTIDCKYLSSTMQGTISCNNGTLVGAQYEYSDCKSDTTVNQSCNLLPTVNGYINNGISVDFYSIQNATYNKTCTQSKRSLKCVNSVLQGDKNTYIYPSCSQAAFASCINMKDSTTGVNNGSTATVYLGGESTIFTGCAQMAVSVSCQNGLFTGAKLPSTAPSSYYTKCTNKTFVDCINPWENKYISHLGTLVSYTQDQSTATKTCSQSKKNLVCRNGDFYSGATLINVSDYFGTCISNCALSGKVFNDGDYVTGYKYGISIYPQICDAKGNSVLLECVKGSWSGGAASVYKYGTCMNGSPGQCKIPNGWRVSQGYVADSGYVDDQWSPNKKTYSVKTVALESDCPRYAGTILCDNGVLKGNAYRYETCTVGEPDIQPGDKIGNIQDGEVCQEWKGCYCSYGTTIVSSISNGDTCYADMKKQQLSIYSIGLSNGGTSLAKNSQIMLNIVLQKGGTDPYTSEKTPEGFITCTVDGKTFKSRSTDSPIRVNANTYQEISNFTLANSQTLTSEEKNLTIGCSLLAYPSDVVYVTFDVVSQGRFDISMNQAKKSIERNLDAGYLQVGTDGIKNYVLDKVMTLVVPIVVLAGILFAIIGFYQILFVGGDSGISKGIQYVIGGVVAILIMMSAKYISTVFYEDILQSGGATALSGVYISQQLYDKIAFPFLKLAVYLVLGIMFIVLLGRVIVYVTSQSDDVKKKAMTSIVWTVVSMLIILGAKQIVQATYGLIANAETETSSSITQEFEDAQNLGELGGGVFSNKNIPIVYEVINWVLGIASLIILVLIIFQTYQMLTNPEDPETFKKVKKSFLYIFIGIMIIGVGYLITNFAIIN